DGVEQRTEAAGESFSRGHQLHLLRRPRRAAAQYRGGCDRNRDRADGDAEERYCSILMLADLTTSPQRATSDLRMSVNSAVEVPTASTPIAFSREATSGSFAIFMNSPSSFFT